MSTSRSRTRITALSALICASALLASSPYAHARAAAAGPPWISIETPVNPYDATTRGAYLLVHAFHHGDPVAYPVSGTAEGIVNGQRKSITLVFTATSRPGAYALRKQWGDVGVWELVITVKQAENDLAQARVEIGADGAVSRVQVPTRVGERNIPFPSLVSAQEIETALRERAKLTVGQHKN
ncbi:MAG: hypothetical protein M3Z05_11250 [Gemmatimonadota bacterium]|nr:hypothetical protein [Gemmatimonadota bacterium]